MRGSAIVEPYVNQPYDLVITSIKDNDPLAFMDNELLQFPEWNMNPPGPGLMAQIGSAPIDTRMLLLKLQAT